MREPLRESAEQRLFDNVEVSIGLEIVGGSVETIASRRRDPGWMWMHESAETAKRKLIVESLRSGRQGKIRALGVSMMPAIWPGDVLVIEAVAAKDIEKGEVAVFERGDRIFAHRVVSREERDGHTVVTTRGDRMAQSDPEVSEQELLGRAVLVERAGREIRMGKRAGVGQMMAAQIVKFDRGVAVFLAIARLLGKTDYPTNVRTRESDSMPRTI